MVIYKKSNDLRDYLVKQKQPIGFVPTMGALHAGHLSLIQSAKTDKCTVVCSIFVNPTQFNDVLDYQLYPISTANDITLLLKSKCDVLFLPDASEVYPNGSEMATAYHFGDLENILEGKQRPGHFRGVGQVVGRLLEIVKPQRIYLGQKDYQQCKIIEKLIELMNLEDQTVFVINPIVREADGLALSSRNKRLTEPQRAVAGTIYQCLVSIQNKAANTSFQIIQKECLDILNAKNFTPEYISLVDGDTLEVLDEYIPDKKMIALIAAKIGDVRLIDNMLLN